ncbi:MAG: acyltransferase [Deltaproteobacteria bacterium]|nr:acyltransferase [Deltaproteobacteria bacterium]
MRDGGWCLVSDAIGQDLERRICSSPRAPVLNLPLRYIHRFYHGIASRLRNLFYRGLGVNIKGYVWMRAIEIPFNWPDITLEASVALDRGVTLLCGGPVTGNKLVIRTGTYVNRYTIFDAHQRLEVGRDCMIGAHCYITDANHGQVPGLSVKSQTMQKAPVTIEDEVWIGSNVVVLPGVHIGRGAVIGAGSVVTGDIPGNAVAVGVPARVLRFRE